MVLGESLVVGEKVVVEKDHELSRHGTKLGLQIYSHSCKPLGFACAVRVVQEGEAGGGDLAVAILGGGLLVRAGT